MKQLLIELDPETWNKLERVAPARSRRRSEFVRAAIRRALWELEEHATEQAYAHRPDTSDATPLEPGWDPPAKPLRRRARHP